MSNFTLWLITVVAIVVIFWLAGFYVPRMYRKWQLSSISKVNLVREVRHKKLTKEREKLDREAEEEIIQVGDYLIHSGEAHSSNKIVLKWFKDAGYTLEHQYGGSYKITIPPVTEKEVNEIMLKK